MAIWVSDFDTGLPGPFWHVVCDEVLPLEKLNKKTRNVITKASRQFSMQLVDKNYVASNCYSIYKKVCNRYSQRPLTRKQFLDDINSKDDNTYEFWAILNRANNEPIGYCYNRCYDSVCYYMLEKIDPEYVNIGASYFSNYYQNCYYLIDRRMKYIDAGARSIIHASNVQDFLITKFNYRKAYCDLKIKYVPMVKCLVLLLHKLLGSYGKGKAATEKINALFKYYEFAQYSESPEYIYMLNTNGDGSERFFIDNQFQVEVFRPTLQQLSKERLGWKRTLLHLSWYFRSKGRYTIAYVLKNKKIVHSSYYIGKYYRFRYMKSNEISMGPAWTDPYYRGAGIYPNVIKYMKSNYYRTSTMVTVVNRGNTSGRRGVEKAGFIFRCFGYTTKLLHVVYEISNE